jgi:hypothetical protein
MLIYDVRSWNVYENKRNMDKMTAKHSDIYGNMTWILQKNSEFDAQFGLIDTFGAGFRGTFAAKISAAVARRVQHNIPLVWGSGKAPHEKRRSEKPSEAKICMKKQGLRPNSSDFCEIISYSIKSSYLQGRD